MENPALYEVAKQISHDMGMDYYDPRTGVKYKAPKSGKKHRKKRVLTARQGAKRRNRRGAK